MTAGEVTGSKARRAADGGKALLGPVFSRLSVLFAVGLAISLLMVWRSQVGGDQLDMLAQHCTEAEDAATKVERRVQKSAAALLLEDRVGEQFDGIITGAADKGTWVRLIDIPVEGKLVRGFQGIDVGDRVRVQLLETDVERGFIDFALVAPLSRVRANP